MFLDSTETRMNENFNTVLSIKDTNYWPCRKVKACLLKEKNNKWNWNTSKSWIPYIYRLNYVLILNVTERAVAHKKNTQMEVAEKTIRQLLIPIWIQILKLDMDKNKIFTSKIKWPSNTKQFNECYETSLTASNLTYSKCT